MYFVTTFWLYVYDRFYTKTTGSWLLICPTGDFQSLPATLYFVVGVTWQTATYKDPILDLFF